MSHCLSSSIHANTQIAVLVSCRGAVLLMIEAHCTVSERQCSMIKRGLIDILPGKRCYLYIITMTAKLANLRKCMILTYASSVTTCIIHAKDDEPYMLTDDGWIPMQCHKRNSDPTITSTRYTPFERCDKQVDHHSAVKQTGGICETDWREDPTLPDIFSGCSDKFINMLTEGESIWDGRLCSIRVVQHRFELEKTRSRPIHSASYSPAPRERLFERQE